MVEEPPSATPLTARTRALLDEVLQGVPLPTPPACVTNRKTQSPRKDEDRPQATPNVLSISPRLMDLLAPQDPKPQEVEVVHASLESLQTTLGAAYMLLAAEAKAESLDAELALAKQTLAEQEEVDHGMHEAHGRCVRDYGELRLVVDDAC